MSAIYKKVIRKRPLEDVQVCNSDNKRIKWAIPNYVIHRKCTEQNIWRQSLNDRGNSSSDSDILTIDKYDANRYS